MSVTKSQGAAEGSTSREMAKMEWMIDRTMSMHPKENGRPERVRLWSRRKTVLDLLS